MSRTLGGPSCRDVGITEDRAGAVSIPSVECQQRWLRVSQGYVQFFNFLSPAPFCTRGAEADISPGWGSCPALTAAPFFPCPCLGQPCWCARYPIPGTGQVQALSCCLPMGERFPLLPSQTGNSFTASENVDSFLLKHSP